MMIEPEKAEILLKKITAFIKDYLHLLMETFPSIDGIFLLDDIIGFTGKEEFLTFGLLNSLADKSRVILSCGGGLPPGVSTENMTVFVQAVGKYSGC